MSQLIYSELQIYNLAAYFQCHPTWGPAHGHHGTGRLLAAGEATRAQALQGAGTAL